MKRVFVLFWVVGGMSWSRLGTAQTAYIADGAPAGIEEEIRWRVNRGRFDSAAENKKRGTAFTDVPVSTGPVAPNQALTVAARHQAEDMAKNNLLQHATLSNSIFYNPITQPQPWDRMQAEGYSWNAAGENIAAGYSGSEAAYVGWWNSTGHRENMYNSDLREIGNGYYYTSAGNYHSFYAMDLGSSGNSRFFTDTAFHDANGDGAYEQAESVPGIAIRLVVGGKLQSSYDVSGAAGSFAVPIQSIGPGASVQVLLSNTTPAQVELSIPRDYLVYTTVTLGPGQSRVFGSFIQPGALRNVGWRDITPAAAAITPPPVLMAMSGTDMLIHWQSESNLEYVVQRSTNFLTWSNVATNQGVAGANASWRDVSAKTKYSRAYYRLLVRGR